MSQSFRIIQAQLRCMSSASSARFLVRDCKIHKLEQGPSTEVELDRESGLKMFTQTVKIRRTEATASILCKGKVIDGSRRPSIEQKAVAVGMKTVLSKGDQAISAYKLHNSSLASGTAPREVLSELTVRSSGTTRGESNFMHLFRPRQSGVNGTVGVQSRYLSTISDTTQIDDSQDDDLFRYLWLRCQSHQVSVLDSYEHFVRTAAEHLDITYVRTEEPWRTIKRKTLLASRFVHKKYRVQYETRTYYRDLLFKNLTGSTADTFLEYVERNLPEGVLLIAERHKLCELPFELAEVK